MRRNILLRYFLLLVMMLSSCAHVISSDNVTASVKGVGLNQLAKEPESYLNNIFIFGGTIAGTTFTKDDPKMVTEIEVVQNPIDKYGAISDRDTSQGRFIVAVSTGLDPMIYHPGRLITVAGRLTGKREKTIGQATMVYPVFQAVEFYLWREDRFYPPLPIIYRPYYERFYFNDFYLNRPPLFP